jgi:hypothetical protein
VYPRTEPTGVLFFDAFVRHPPIPCFTNITAAEEFRAAFNDSFVSSDPGGCVHNGWDAAQLLYESMDELAAEI